jgi:hypothetical protein
MGLIRPSPPAFTLWSSNLTGTPAIAPGTTLTPGAANVDGSVAPVLSALSHDCELLVIQLANGNDSATNNSRLVDIMIDPAGGTSWTALINDLMCGYSPSFDGGDAGGAGEPRTYYFPLWLKAGTSIGARIRAAQGAAGTISVLMTAHGGNQNPGSWWCGQAVTEIGIDAANSKGTNHTSGSTGSFSSWTNFGSTTPAPAGAIQYGLQYGGDTTVTSLAYHVEFGAGSTRIGPTFYQIGFTVENIRLIPQVPIFCSIPSGTQLQVRATCSGSPETLDVAAYVVH